MKSGSSVASSRASRSPSPPARLQALRHKSMAGSRAPSRVPSILGKGQFSIYLPRRVDSEYYVKSPVKVKAEMYLCPEHLGAGGLHVKAIPCSARAEKLTEDNHFGVVNVPIKIEAEVLLSPGVNYSCKTTTPLYTGVDNRPQCTVRIIEPEQQRPPSYYDAAESWQLWECKTRDSIVKYQAGPPHRFEKAPHPQPGIMVEELKLDDNCKRTKDLSRQLTSYVDQVLEQNRKIQKLQEKVREEESRGTEICEKFHVAEQQCKALEQKLKAAERRAKVAERRAEAVKQKTRALSVLCGYQGVQLKDVARQIDCFVKNLEAQRAMASDCGSKEHHRRRSVESARSPENLCTVARTKPVRLPNIPSETESDAHEKTPDLNTPSTNCFYQTVTVQELSDKYVLFLCRRSHRVVVDEKGRFERDPEGISLSDEDQLSGLQPLAFRGPMQHAELLLNQLLQMAPNWHVEFDSSMQRAEELTQKCVAQALKLRDLSRELDCFPSSAIVLSREQLTAVSSTSTTPSKGRCPTPSKGRVKFVEEDVITPSPESTPQSEATARVDQTLPLHSKVAEQANRCLEKYLFNLAEAAEALVPSAKKSLLRIHVGTQTEWAPKHEQPETSCISTIPLPVACKVGLLPERYEIKAWRIAFRTMVQGLLLWLGLVLLPDVSFGRFPPPPT